MELDRAAFRASKGKPWLKRIWKGSKESWNEWEKSFFNLQCMSNLFRSSIDSFTGKAWFIALQTIFSLWSNLTGAYFIISVVVENSFKWLAFFLVVGRMVRIQWDNLSIDVNVSFSTLATKFRDQLSRPIAEDTPIESSLLIYLHFTC